MIKIEPPKKARKSYRFSHDALIALDQLKRLYPEWTDTGLIEAAIIKLAEAETAEREAMREALTASPAVPKQRPYGC